MCVNPEIANNTLPDFPPISGHGRNTHFNNLHIHCIYFSAMSGKIKMYKLKYFEKSLLITQFRVD